MLWDFKKHRVAAEVLQYFGYDENLIPPLRPVFSEHGLVCRTVAAALGLRPGIPVSYKAGDQLNNALSLNVLRPGEVAATAGTSGVIYAVTDRPFHDKGSRVNSFAHVNHSRDEKRLGVLLCINGCGIMNSWLKKQVASDFSYEWLNEAAAKVPVGSEGLKVLPFGNGAERMLHNKTVGAHFIDLNLTTHGAGHLARAVQEGIAFAFRYGLDIMRENGLEPKVVRAGRANLFLSEVFLEAFCNSTELEVALYRNDGSMGAALGAGIGAAMYESSEDAFRNLEPVKKASPCLGLYPQYENHYHQWKQQLVKHLNP
jgi:xylulokinase